MHKQYQYGLLLLCNELSEQGYSENGTNLKVNENGIALLYNKEW